MNNELRQNIHTIQINSELTETEKSQQIFQLLNLIYQNLQKSFESESDSESKFNYIYGCKHYNRNVYESLNVVKHLFLAGYVR